MLYTRKGDTGTTRALDTAGRVSKASALPEALGTLDELNSHIGFARAITRRQPTSPLPVNGRKLSVEALLKEVQENLFIVQAELAGAPKKITKQKVARAELVTDTIEKAIPPITGFSIAGGTELSALLDVTRTIARRAERRTVAVHEANLRTLSTHTLAYLNRLSSVLFALARFANFAAGVPEEKPTYQ